MTMTSDKARRTRSHLSDYGFARVRDVAFQAVMSLWRKRQEEGLTQLELAKRLGKDPGALSRALNAPGNWTMRTFGELVAALNGEAEISVAPLEEPAKTARNSDAYSGYDIQDHPRQGSTQPSVLQAEQLAVSASIQMEHR
jgi:transcriptional regulator with XRE-family HTH domain